MMLCFGRKMKARTKTDRVVFIESHFSTVTTDGKIEYKCNECNAIVQCREGSGAPGRQSHLRARHPGVTIPASRSYKKKPEQAPTTQAAHAEDVETRKRQRELDENELLDFVAENLLPFSITESRFCSRRGVTRKNCGEKMAARARALTTAFATANARDSVSFSVDSGTNVHRTANVCLVHKGVSRSVAALRLPTHSSEAIQKAVSLVVGEVGLKPTSDITDNASNRRLATDMLAEEHGCVYGTRA